MTAVRNPACLYGGLALLATTIAVPFLSRQGQVLPFGRADFALTPLALAGQYPGFWLLIGLAVAWVALGLLWRDRPDRPALWGGLLGCPLVIWLTIAAGTKPYAFGLGSLLAMTACLLVLAYGLSQGGFIRADTFVAASILLLGFFVLIFVIFPIVAVLQHSVMDAQGAFRAGLFLETLQRYKSFWRVLGNSLGLAVFVGIASTLIGLAFALAATRSRSRLTVLLRAFSLLPMITPPFVVGLAIILLFGLQGLITGALLGLKTRGIFGFPGVALAQTLSFAPVAFLVIASVVESVNPALEEASLTLRAGPWATFWKVTLPLLRPGVANAFLLTIVESLADFGNPIILGGEFEVLSTEIYFAIIGRFDKTLAASLGIVLLSASLVAFLLQQYWLGNRSYVTVTGKPPSGKPQRLPRGWRAYGVRSARRHCAPPSPSARWATRPAAIPRAPRAARRAAPRPWRTGCR